MIIKNLTIKLVVGGFLLAGVLIIIMGQDSYRKSTILADQTELMYRHPFAVSNAILAANANINSMHRYMKDIALARNANDLERATFQINKDEKEVFKHFDIVMDRFLGDKSKIKTARQTFSDWKNIRSEVIALLWEGKDEEAALITKGKSAEHVAHLTEQMNSLINFAQGKAAAFLSQSQTVHKKTVYQLNILMAALLFTLGVVGVFVTKKVASAETRLRDNLDRIDLQERRFRSMFNAISDGIVLADTDRRIVAANKGMMATFGYEEQELLGRKTSMLYESVEEFERQGQLRYNLSVKERSEPYNVFYRHKDGHIFPAETLGTAVKHEDGEIIYFVGVIRDVTERNEMEKTLRQSQKMDSLGNLAGGIAHDVNNMLLPIITLSEMTRKSLPEGSRDRKRLEKVVEAGNKARDLVAGILAFSHRSDLGVKRENTNIVTFIEESLEIVRSTLPKTIKVTTDLDPSTGIVRCDPSQVSSMILNMASNSADAMEGHVGELSICVVPVEVKESLARRVANLKPGQYAKLTVSDSGKGMDDSTLKQIFDPFFTTKDVGEGTGLGLAMAYGIITKHGGAIDVSSKVGVGTTFDIYLPLAGQEDLITGAI